MNDQQPHRNQSELNDELFVFPLPQPVGFVQLKESLDEIEASSADWALLFWILGVLFFGLGDTITSFLVFSRGGSELNPFMRFALSLPGELLGFVFVKTLALVILYATAFLWNGPHRWMIPLIMTIAGVYLTVSNTWAYLNIAG